MNTPRLTIVVACRTVLSESRPVIEHLRRQTLARDLEVILVARRGAVDPAELAAIGGFESLRLVEVDRVENRGEAAAHGLLLARAPFAGPCENHAFPDPDVLEKLIEGRGPADAAVSPTMRTANPESLRSLAMYLATYWHAAAPADAGPRERLPYHNGIWPTHFLKASGDRLPWLMSDEARLQAEARGQGLKLRVHPDAVTWHVNESRWSRAVKDPFILSMRFAISRGRAWRWPKRMVYAAAAPLIALIQWWTLLGRALRLTDTRGRVPALVPMLGLTAGALGAGEAWGYLFPGTPTPAQFEAHEFHVRGRLAGIAPAAPWLREIVRQLPSDLA